MNIQGEKVRVRDWEGLDYVRESQWRQDEEINRLDPSAGTSFNHQRYSIETLDGKHIGSCSLYNFTMTEVQLGIRIGVKDYWGQGYGTEAVNILTDHCFRESSVGLIWLKVLPENERAIRCYEKCGFVQTGRLALDGYDFIRMDKTRR